MMESETLPCPAVLSGLEQFVWVKAYEDKTLNTQFDLSSYPTLVFLDSSSGRVLEQSSGYESPELFFRHVIAARRAAGLPSTKDMERLQGRMFDPDPTKLQAFIDQGDADGLVEYLAPARDDGMRGCNYFVARLRLPRGVKPADVLAMVYNEYTRRTGPSRAFARSTMGNRMTKRLSSNSCEAKRFAKGRSSLCVACLRTITRKWRSRM